LVKANIILHVDKGDRLSFNYPNISSSELAVPKSFSLVADGFGPSTGELVGGSFVTTNQNTIITAKRAVTNRVVVMIKKRFMMRYIPLALEES